MKSFKAYEEREVQKKPWNSLLVQFHQLSRGKRLLLHVLRRQVF